MANKILAFDIERCDVEAVERVPPCDNLLTDESVPDAPDAIAECDPDIPPLDGLSASMWNDLVRMLGQWKRNESAAVTITSSAAVAGRYQAVRRIQTGLLSTWGTAEQVWVYNTQQNGLPIGLTLANARYNTDQFFGMDQLAVDWCCSTPPQPLPGPPGSGVCAAFAEIPTWGYDLSLIHI